MKQSHGEVEWLAWGCPARAFQSNKQHLNYWFPVPPLSCIVPFWTTATSYPNCWHDNCNVAVFSQDFLCLCWDHIKTSVLLKSQVILSSWPELPNLLSNDARISFAFHSYVAIAYVQKRSRSSLIMQENTAALHCVRRERQKSRVNGTSIHTRPNFKGCHEMYRVMMHRFHAVTAKGIATEAELWGLTTAVPGHFRLQQQQPKNKKG